MIGKSHGIEPSTAEELHEQRGQMAHHTFDPRFTESVGAIVDQAFGLFFEYIHAITSGRLSVETRIVPLADLDVPMRVFDDPGGQPRAELVPGALDRMWGTLDEERRSSTPTGGTFSTHLTAPNNIPVSITPISATAAVRTCAPVRTRSS
jgi:hypothetical protein